MPLPSFRFAFGARTGGAHETVQIDNLFIGSGGPPTDLGLRFTDIFFNSQTRDCTITWTSRQGANYIIEASPDLQNWEELQDGYEGEEEETSFTDQGIPADVKMKYYRGGGVTEEEG